MIFSTKNIKNFVTKNKEHLTFPTLAKHLEGLCIEKGIKARDVVKNADIDRVYGAKIFTGKRINPSRDYVIRLAFGFGLNYEECQELLEVADKSKLYPRNPRDVVLINCLHKKQTFREADEILFEMGLPMLVE